MTPRNCLAVVTALVVMFAAAPMLHSKEKQDKAKDIDKIPKVVMDALKAKFPKAEIRKWTKEKEGDDEIYDIEFTENGRACEADIRENGTYINFEKAVAAKDLPAAVTKAIDAKFPKATLREIMEETEVTGKDEKLVAYEVVLVAADKSTVEIKLSLDGKILEEEVLSTKQDSKPEPAATAAGHEFLKRFVGEWDCESEVLVAPDKPMKSKATMTGHMIGNYWAVVVVKGDVLGQPYNGQGTFGFDSQKKRFIGTWADSMTDFLWRYDGVVEGDKLVLDSEGPIPGEPGILIKSRDTWEFKGKDQVVLTGEVQGPDGKMTPMMKATCIRKK
jgi:hypothetical protein